MYNLALLYMSKKPFLYSDYAMTIGQDLLYTQYDFTFLTFIILIEMIVLSEEQRPARTEITKKGSTEQQQCCNNQEKEISF